MDFHGVPVFPAAVGNSGVPPPKFCASTVARADSLALVRLGDRRGRKVESHEPGHRNFNRELYYEFPTKTSRNEGLSVAHQAAQVNKTAQAAPYLLRKGCIQY